MDTTVDKLPKWRANSTAQRAFFAIGANAYEALFGGTKGPGKTDCLIQEALRQRENPRYHGLLIRRTFKQLQEIIDRTHRWYPSCGGVYKQASQRWEFLNGAKITMGHCQHEGDKYNYQGHEYHYIGFDQLEQFTESIYDYMLAQQRTSDPSLYCYVRSTANPGGVGHGWVKRRFITAGKPGDIIRVPIKLPDGRQVEVTRVFIPSSVYDNPAIMLNDPMYVARLQALPENLRKAFLEGNWDAFEGQFFNMWDPKVHVLTPFALPPHWTRFVSLDYGYRAPSSVGWWANDEQGGVVRYQELYQEGLTYHDLAQAILARNTFQGQWQPLLYLTADPAIWSDISHHKGDLRGQTGYEIMQAVFDADAAQTGRPIIRIIKADNDRVNGWMRMRERMMPIRVGDRVTARLRVFSTCEAFVRTIPEQIHDDEGGNPEDLDTTGEDHAADDARYAVMSRPVASETPRKAPTVTESFWKDVRADVQRTAQADIQADEDAEAEVEFIR